MTQPSDKAMQAARAINYFVRGSEDLDIDYTNVAEALTRFAADAVREAVAAENTVKKQAFYWLRVVLNDEFSQLDEDTRSSLHDFLVSHE